MQPSQSPNYNNLTQQRGDPPSSIIAHLSGQQPYTAVAAVAGYGVAENPPSIPPALPELPPSQPSQPGSSWRPHAGLFPSLAHHSIDGQQLGSATAQVYPTAGYPHLTSTLAHLASNYYYGGHYCCGGIEEPYYPTIQPGPIATSDGTNSIVSTTASTNSSSDQPSSRNGNTESIDAAPDLCSKVGGKQRQRNLFLPTQVRALERAFTAAQFINSGMRAHLAGEVGLTPNQVKIWYQNRRYKQKKLQKDIEFGLRLKSCCRGEVAVKLATSLMSKGVDSNSSEVKENCEGEPVEPLPALRKRKSPPRTGLPPLTPIHNWPSSGGLGGVDQMTPVYDVSSTVPTHQTQPPTLMAQTPAHIGLGGMGWYCPNGANAMGYTPPQSYYTAAAAAGLYAVSGAGWLPPIAQMPQRMDFTVQDAMVKKEEEGDRGK